MNTLIPAGARVTPLKDKLAHFGERDFPDSWFNDAIRVLRGGDGGHHGLLLYKLVSCLKVTTPPVILDIGTARGFSAITMARALLDSDSDGTVYSIDVVDHEGRLSWHSAKNDAVDPLAGISISRSEVWSRWFADEATRVTPIRGQSKDVLGNWSFGSIDIAFIDGEHTYDSVKRDLTVLGSLMTPTGVIALDDYHPGVSMGAIRSRPLNGAVRLLSRVSKQVMPSIGERLRLGTGNEFLVVKRRYAGVYRAVSEFLLETTSEWKIEIVSMPPRRHQHEVDYSLALLKRTSS